MRRTSNAYGGSLSLSLGGRGVLSSCTFTNNTAISTATSNVAGGGAIYVIGRGRLRMTDCVVKGNSAISPSVILGGALYANKAGAISLLRTTFTGNLAQVGVLHVRFQRLYVVYPSRDVVCKGFEYCGLNVWPYTFMT